eukprot:TRINITY_DN3667_c0_g1_i1.p1 TRINITY_DN3667_c0_g1~~TRINITY_DN3667_c0_g1_i1.p1  ORF type:complete len:183 (-),score=21.12 TRINITY_DN3667_c0_g1_i1:315-863(-)
MAESAQRGPGKGSLKDDSNSASVPPPFPSNVNSTEPAFHMPSPEEIMMQDVMNNCAVRSVMSGVMGGVSGVFFGLLFTALEQPTHAEPSPVPFRQQVVQGTKYLANRSWSSAKYFALLGAIYSASECVVEKARAKHDISNAAIAGCMTGGILSARAGPQAACGGCAAFAAFSVAIEHFFTGH